jgi:hypothetical protein
MTEVGNGLDGATEESVYSYRPSLLGQPAEFRLTCRAIEWRIGALSGQIPYDQVRRVRLSFRPVTMQFHRFVAEIWPSTGPKLSIVSVSWRSFLEQERQDHAYRAFLTEFHRRLTAAGSRATFETGTPAALFWPGYALFLAVTFVIAGLLVHALQTRAFTAALMIAAFLGLFLWQVGSYFRRNRPGRYRPDAIPPQVLPR